MHLHQSPQGPFPNAIRIPVPDGNHRPGGIAAQYALDSVDWLWDSAHPATEAAFRLFRLNFISDGKALRFQVTGDQFFWLYLNGHVIARGPDVSPPWHYGFAEYEVAIHAGEHTLEAFVWWIGDHASEARMTHGIPGFALAGIGEWREKLSTGIASWKIADVAGYILEPNAPQAQVLATGKNSLIDARAFYKHTFEWKEPVISQTRIGNNPWGLRKHQRVLAPSALPEMPVKRIAPGIIRAATDFLLENLPLPESALHHPDLENFQSILEEDGVGISVPAHSHRTFIWDLQNYHSGWPEVTVSGGRDTVIRQIWAESFYETQNCGTKNKGNRNDITGKYIVSGLGDRFITDGGKDRRFVPYWWRAGRYCRIDISTGDEPLIVHSVALLASGHPFVWKDEFSCDLDAFLKPIMQICRRTLEVSSWDSYQDSPYYEQLQYIGDTRLEMLMTYVMSEDASLPLRALEMMEQSRHQWNGLAASRFPCRGPQFISTFSLIYICCVKDLLYWRGEEAFVGKLLPGVRNTLDILSQWSNAEGLLENAPGWPYIDWVTPDRQFPGVWQNGVPACGRVGVSSLVNLVYLMALDDAHDMENQVGQPEMAERWKRMADTTRKALRNRFWCVEKTALKDDDSGNHWSTQAQILGIITGVLSQEEGSGALDRAVSENWVPASYMFRFYEYEALRIIGRAGEIISKLESWQEMVDKGSCTVWEGLEPTRSDCHAWSSHPLFHLPCSVAGIRPVAPGFRQWEIRPRFGILTRISATIAHPQGKISMFLEKTGERFTGFVDAAKGTHGLLWLPGSTVPLQMGAGMNKVDAEMRIS